MIPEIRKTKERTNWWVVYVRRLKDRDVPLEKREPETDACQGAMILEGDDGRILAVILAKAPERDEAEAERLARKVLEDIDE